MKNQKTSPGHKKRQKIEKMSKKSTIGGRLAKICQFTNQEDLGKWRKSDVKPAASCDGEVSGFAME